MGSSDNSDFTLVMTGGHAGRLNCKKLSRQFSVGPLGPKLLVIKKKGLKKSLEKVKSV